VDPAKGSFVNGVILPVCRSITVPSEVAMRRPSDENASAEDGFPRVLVGDASYVTAGLPSRTFQIVRRPISLARPASHAPSGENAMASMLPRGAATCAISCQRSVR